MSWWEIQQLQGLVNKKSEEMKQMFNAIMSQLQRNTQNQTEFPTSVHTQPTNHKPKWELITSDLMDESFDKSTISQDSTSQE